MKKLIFLFLFLISVPTFVSADIAGDATDKMWSFGGKSGVLVNETPNTPSSIIANSIKILLGLLGAIFLIMIMSSGLQWMTSGGDNEKIGKAKKRIANATIGLSIILASYIITLLVITLTNASVHKNGSFF